MKTVWKIVLLPVAFILLLAEYVARFLSHTAQIVVTAIGGILLLVVAAYAVLGIAPLRECLRNGLAILAAVTVIYLSSGIAVLLHAARTALMQMTETLS